VECFVCEGLAESPGERIIKSQDPLDLGPWWHSISEPKRKKT
jgi:hypothetical protein